MPFLLRCDSELKSGCQVALEEDEGFSDWTQRLEKHKQRHIEEQEARDDRGLQFNGNYRPSPKSDSVPNEHEEEWERSVNRKTQDVSKTFTDDKVNLPDKSLPTDLDVNKSLTSTKLKCSILGDRKDKRSEDFIHLQSLHATGHKTFEHYWRWSGEDNISSCRKT